MRLKKDDCCTARLKCADATAATGWEKKATPPEYCSTSASCSKFECCDLVEKTCSGAIAAGFSCDETTAPTWIVDDTKSTAATTMGTFVIDCCKRAQTCVGISTDPTRTDCTLNEQEFDYAKLSTATTPADYKTDCCIAVAKCKDHSCDANKGWLADTTKDGVFCPKGVDGPGCVDALCCKPDPAKCRGYTPQVCPNTDGKTDGYNAQAEDANAGKSVADADEFLAKCCGKKATCAAAKTFTSAEGSAAGAPRQHEPVMAVFLASTVVLAFRGM